MDGLHQIDKIELNTWDGNFNLRGVAALTPPRLCTALPERSTDSAAHG